MSSDLGNGALRERARNIFGQKRIVDFAEVVDYLRIKQSHARHLVFTRAVPFFRVGRLLRFDLDEIDTWIEAQKAKALGERHGR